MEISFETRGGGARPNEDFACGTPTGVVVLDGVSSPAGLETGCRHDVAWYVSHLGAGLARALREPGDLPRALFDAITDVTHIHRDTCDTGNPATPAAAVAVLRQRDESFEYLVLADTSIILDTTTGIHVVTDTRVDYAAPAELERTKEAPIGSPEHRASVAEMAAAQLARRNVEGGYWVAAANPHAADHAVTGRVPFDSLTRAAVLTDGASRAVDTFHELDWSSFLDFLDEHGPHGLINLVRNLEDRDPHGRRWPRFKRSDDASVAFLRPTRKTDSADPREADGP